ncbi:phage holin family protein [Adlercreutzia muris]|uniref:phage holin family protein n=1 Tax=Adlercreutzia muris TaxID=1796610 RepID=UPI001365EE75|nr:phage holin family protein [Adlercreutzia muris]
MDALLAHWQVVLVAVAMMALDMLTGFGGALKQGVVMSGKMREGLWHKAGFCGLIVLTVAYEVGAKIINADVSQSMPGSDFTMPELPAVAAVCAIIALIEVVSILENLSALNPVIASLPFVDRIKAHDPSAPDVTVGIEDVDEMAFSGRSGQ